MALITTCKPTGENLPPCTVRETWEQKQERILMRYKKTGDENSLESHLKYLEKVGGSIMFTHTPEGFEYFNVEVPFIDFRDFDPNKNYPWLK